MKKIIAIGIFLAIIFSANAQEKKIKFNKGVLKICTSAKMKISGYDGDEVIIKSLNGQNAKTLYGVVRNLEKKPGLIGYRLADSLPKTKDSILKSNFRVLRSYSQDRNLEKGLKPLGTKSTNPADNLYLDIDQKPGELIIKDYEYDQKKNIVRISHNYEVLIPNTIKLLWNTDNCKKTTRNTFFAVSSKPWELNDFNGEVEISSSYGSINLTDVTGPVLVNTVGGNIKVVFEKTTPKKLYSLISSDGHIDVQLPKSSSVKIDASGRRILSDIDFKIITENLIGNDTKTMNLELNGGKNKMKINAGYGNIYLRKL